MKLTKLAATAGLLLAGCSSTPQEEPNEAVSHFNKLSEQYIAVLGWNGKNYEVVPKLYSDRITALNDTSYNHKFLFNPITLIPQWDTSRKRCEYNTKNDCTEYEGREAEFLHVNKTQHAYGNFYGYTKPTILDNYGKLASEKPIKATLISPFLAIGVATVGVATLITPKRWVEFNHDSFNEEVQDAIENSSIGSHDNLIEQVILLDAMRVKNSKFLDPHDKDAMDKISGLNRDLSLHYHRHSVGVTKPDPIEFKSYDTLRSNDYDLPINTVLLSANLESASKAHYQTLIKSAEEQYAASKNKLILNYTSTQKMAFTKATTEYQLGKFVENYSDNDVLGLVPKAKVKIASIQAEEAKQAELRKQQRIARLKARSDYEADWRKTLKQGDDTFCGPVLERRGNLIHIAISAQLSNFPGEQWLKLRDVYPANRGCNNVNNNLTPLHK